MKKLSDTPVQRRNGVTPDGQVFNYVIVGGEYGYGVTNSNDWLLESLASDPEDLKKIKAMVDAV